MPGPNKPIGTLPMLSDEERRQMLIQWNDTADDPVADLDAMLNDLSAGGITIHE